MEKNSRRKFIFELGTVSASVLLTPNFLTAKSRLLLARQFKMSLNPGAVGIQANQWQTLEIAHQYGFEAISAFANPISTMSDEDLEVLKGKMNEYNIEWGTGNLPVEFRRDIDTFRKHIKRLPAIAKRFQEAGATRMNTWILNASDDLTYHQNFDLHKSRLGEASNILMDFGISLGLEYVGPKTSMIRRKFPFIRTLAETRELISTISYSNVGLVLDSFHWYTAGDSKEDLLGLSNSDVIAVDLNDAIEGRTANEQIDGERQLPMASGLIDLKSFLEALVIIEYDGPVRAEPFNKELAQMDNDAAAEATYAAMKSAFDLIS